MESATTKNKINQAKTVLTESAFYSRTWGVTAYRMILSLILIWEFWSFLPYSEDFFGINGLYNYAHYSGNVDGSWWGILGFPFAEPGNSKLLLLFAIILAGLFFFGVFRYLTGILLFICIFNFRIRNPYIFDGSDDVIYVTLPFLIFVESISFFKFKMLKMEFARFKSLKTNINKVALWGLLVQICFIYFFSFISKLNTEVWREGMATYYAFQVDRYNGSKLNSYMIENLYFIKFSTYSTLLFEIAFSIAVWFKKTKWIILLTGILFHWIILVFLDISIFSIIMISSYFMFITNKEYCKIYLRFRKQKPFRSSPREIEKHKKQIGVSKKQS